jgi:hypothetical protein
MRRKDFSFILFFLAVFICMSSIAWSQIKTNSSRQGHRNSVMSQLTTDQRQELKAKVQAMKQAGASKEDIRTTVQSMLHGWGITTNQGGKGSWGAQLTDDQKKQLEAKVQAMKKAGASEADIKTAVQAMIQSWGINMPNKAGQSGRGSWLRGNWMSQLTDDQKKQLEAKVQAMKQTGASKDDIKTAIQNMVQGWGIKPQGQTNITQQNQTNSTHQNQTNTTYPGLTNTTTQGQINTYPGLTNTTTQGQTNKSK